MTRLRELAEQGGTITARVELFRAHQPGTVGSNGGGTAAYGGSHPIIDGRITTSGQSAITRTCDITVAGEPPSVLLRDGFSPNGAYLRVHTGIVDPVDGQLVERQQGVFIIEEVEIGQGTVRMQGYDLGWHVANNPRDSVKAYPPGTALRTVVDAELSRHMPAFLWHTSPQHPDAPSTTPELADYAIFGSDPQNNPMTDLQELAADYGFRLFFWVNGVAALVPVRALIQRNAVWSFEHGQGAYISGDRRLKGLTPNRVVGRYRVGTNEPQRLVVAEDRATNSPTHADLYTHTIVLPGGIVDHLSEARDAVEGELAEHRGMADTISIGCTSTVAALLDPHDVVLLRDPRLGVTAATPYRVDSTEFSLGGGEARVVVHRQAGAQAHAQVGGR